MQNPKAQAIETARAAATSYPDLAHKLKAIGITGYLFEVASQIVIYRYSDDSIFIENHAETRNLQINPQFSREGVTQAILDNQKGLTDFPTFLQQIATAGIKAYDADFDEMLVSYFGTRDVHVEGIGE